MIRIHIPSHAEATSLALINCDGEPRADSRILAVRLRNNHKSVMELIDRYLTRFESFGLVPFKTEAVKEAGARGTKHTKFALLNENQCYFLLALSRNTDHVVDLKAELVRKFSDARTNQDHLISMSLWNQRLNLEKRDETTSMWAKFGSKLMLKRKKALPEIRGERARLEEDMQGRLFTPRSTAAEDVKEIPADTRAQLIKQDASNCPTIHPDRATK